uniref:U1-type domain-containing protein n=1 Tax=Amphimedon queenslandica TaxID=400682 RepID=A0A1X7THB0_AMPQE
NQPVNTFKGEHLTDSNNKLFCAGCRKELSVKCSVVRIHINSSKHKSGKEQLSKKGQTEMDISHALQSSDEAANVKGETLPEEQRVYQVKVVTCYVLCSSANTGRSSG